MLAPCGCIVIRVRVTDAWVWFLELLALDGLEYLEDLISTVLCRLRTCQWHGARQGVYVLEVSIHILS